jgi:putative GTP pyrophosphokinase
MDTAESITNEFVKHKALYQHFAECANQLLNALLKKRGIVVHSISYRLKDSKSLYEKAKRPGKNYNSISDITDLVGLRVITYLPEDVDKVADVVNSEFTIDEVNSIDKRLTNDPHRFGYGSDHRICSLNHHRVELNEYSAYSGLKCEIQIRTILQHAWAEIEHDLGYKSDVGIPVSFKRRFSRLAALLESADEEFMRLKKDLAEYVRQSQNGAGTVKPGTPLDRISLESFIQTNDLLRVTENAVHWSNEAGYVDVSPDNLDWYIKCLNTLGVTHVDSLAYALQRHQGLIPKAVNRCEEVDYGADFCQVSPTQRGWPIWTLIQLLCAELPTREQTIEAMKKINLLIADSLEGYADSLRSIIRGNDTTNIRVQDYKSVYVTIERGRSFALALQSDKWVWSNITLTDENVVIDGASYPIQSKKPLLANVIHKGRRYIFTW